jgi:hypothetical protein
VQTSDKKIPVIEEFGPDPVQPELLPETSEADGVAA